MTDVLPKPAKSARKPKGEGHARRGEILAAAERIFIECGYEGATIRKIADEVGVSSTALYMHFRDKSEILLEICQQAFAELLASHLETAALAIPPEAKVRAMLESHMAFGLANPNVYRLVFLTRPVVLGQEDSAAHRVGRQALEVFRRYVAEAVEAGRLRGEVTVVSQTLWAGVHGLVALVITNPQFDWASQEKLTTGMLDALFDGLAVR